MAWLTRLLERVLLRRSETWGLRVVATRQVTPHMLRIEFAGTQLGRFATDGNLHVRLLLPPPRAARAAWLEIGRDGRARRAAGGPEPVYRKYTIRTIDAASGRLAIDFVLHGDTGPGSAWAARARPGDVIGMIGPGGRGVPAAAWLLLAGDETALPAIGRILEALPADARGIALIEVAGAAEQQDLRAPANMTLRWLHRHGAAAGTTTLLADAVREVVFPPEGTVFAWAAAEFTAIRDIRAYLRQTRKLDRQSHLAVAYWRRGEAAADGRPSGA
jgi:NADPH-dependent ferric siderophore reductase